MGVKAAMVRIAVVEDSEQDRKALLDCLHRYEKEQKLKFSIEEFQDGEDIVTGYSADYDLLLMDIEMTFMNGMKAAEKIRELDKDVEKHIEEDHRIIRENQKAAVLAAGGTWEEE